MDIESLINGLTENITQNFKKSEYIAINRAQFKNAIKAAIKLGIQIAHKENEGNKAFNYDQGKGFS